MGIASNSGEPPVPAPEQAFDDLNEQFSRGEIELDKVLQRFVKICEPAPDTRNGKVFIPERIAPSPAMTVPAFLKKPVPGSDEAGAPTPPPEPAERMAPQPFAAAAAVAVAAESPAKPADDVEASDAPAPAPPAANIFPVLGGRFKLEACLAHGDLADVYSARDLHAAVHNTDSAVTLGILTRRAFDDPWLLGVILRSASEKQGLRPAQDSKVLELHRLDGRYVIISDCLDSRCLMPLPHPPRAIPADESVPGDAIADAPRSAVPDGRAWTGAWLVVLGGLLAAGAWFMWTRAPDIPTPTMTVSLPADQPSITPWQVVVPEQSPAALPVAVAAPTPEATGLPPVPAPSPAKAPASPPAVGFVSGDRVVVSESTPFILLKVGASGRLREQVDLSVQAVGGSAKVNEDFVPPVARVSLSRQQPVANVLVSLLADTTRESAEEFSVVLDVEKGNARLGTGEMLVVLNDDD